GRRRRRDFLERAMVIARDLGARVVSLWSGVPPAAAPDVCRQRLVEGVQAIARCAEATGVALGFEPEPGMLVESVTDFLTLGAAGAAVYLGDPDRPVLRLAATLGQRAADGAPWPVEMAWGKGSAGGGAAEPVTEVENDRAMLTVPLLLGEDEVGAVIVSSGARVFGGVDTADLALQFRALARALAPDPLTALRDELARRIPPPAREWLEA